MMYIEERNSRWSLERPQVSGAIFFVTFRLAGSIAQAVVERLRAAQQKWLHRFALRGTNPAERFQRAQKLLFGRLDDFLDRSSDRDWLARPTIATLVRDCLRCPNGKYELLAYCIMPNHVHALIRLPEPATESEEVKLGEQHDTIGPLARVMLAWKNSTAPKAQELLDGPEPIWHPESYVQLVCDDEELHRLVDYIAYNPVKAGLARQVHEWPWCSAHDRFQNDGCETAWLPTDLALG
jgi:REP element-mobilizing transposase RayT